MASDIQLGKPTFLTKSCDTFCSINCYYKTISPFQQLEYGLQNETGVQISLPSNTMSYPLNLMANQTYTIKVYASNSIGVGPAEMITWPIPGEPTL